MFTFVRLLLTTSLLFAPSLLDFLPAGHGPDSAWPQSPDTTLSVLKWLPLGFSSNGDCCPAPAHLCTLMLPVSAVFVPSNQECLADKWRFDRPRAPDCSHSAVLHGFVLLLAENFKKVILIFCPTVTRSGSLWRLEVKGQRLTPSEKGWCSWELLCCSDLEIIGFYVKVKNNIYKCLHRQTGDIGLKS